MATVTQTASEALAYFESGKYTQAEDACRKLLAGNPRNVDLLRLLAVIARRTERFELSIDTLRRAISHLAADTRQTVGAYRRRDYLGILWFELASSFRQARREDDAIHSFRRALEFDPTLQEAYVNLGGMLEQQERFEEALPIARRAVELKAECPLAHYNLGNLYRAVGEVQTAAACYERAVELNHNYARAHWNLAICYLLLGDFERGWREYEWRVPSSEVVLDPYPYPYWRGESLAGKTILINAEQGIGDEVLFASCFDDVILQAKRCVILCEPRLTQLFGRSFPQATIHGYQRRKDCAPAEINEPIDLQVPAGSLPLYLRKARDSFPQRHNYLLADAAQRSFWQQRFDDLGPGLTVGISWRAGGKPLERRKRTTTLEDWLGILSLQGVKFINLQYGECAEELEAAYRQFGIRIHDWQEADPLLDMDGFAAKVAALDLVISVGNATVHLAGALGAKTWCLLPKCPGWRWMLSGDGVPWYSSVRLFRQSKHGEWSDVLTRIEIELRALTGRASTASPASRERKPSVNVDLGVESRLLDRMTIPEALNVAVRHHRSGQLEQAETMYREILAHAPRMTDALHLLGVLAQQTGRVELAIRSIQKAIALCAGAPVMHFNLGNSLRDARQLPEAIASFRRAVELDPRFVEALLNLGVALQATGQAHEAISYLQHAAEVRPDCADVQLNLGHSLSAVYRLDEGLAAYQEAIRLRPDFVQAYSALGAALIDDDRPEEALTHLQKAVQLEATHAPSHNNLGTALRKLDRPDEAAASYREALRFDSNCFEALANLGDLLHAQGNSAEAEPLLLRGLDVQPNNAALHNNLGMVQQAIGKFHEALASYEKAILLDPNYAMAHSNRALLLLQTGRFTEGWDEYEWRWHCPGGPRPRNFFQQPAWDGSSLNEKTILVHGEQGIGDEIMFASCLPEVIAQAGHCVITCHQRLAGLFGCSFPEATVHGVVRGMEHTWRIPAEPRIDVQIASGSLPRHLRRGAESFPRRQSFLKPDPRWVEVWHERFRDLGPGLKIGISWRGGKKPEDRRQRWVPLDLWQNLLRTPDVYFVNLQYGDCQSELLTAEREFGVTIHTWPDADPLGNLDEFAAQIAALDLVISVGNATVHLAGALGIETWALLPCYGGWRWPAGRDDTLWYPSVRLFRQPQPGRWDDALSQVQSRLAAL